MPRTKVDLEKCFREAEEATGLPLSEYLRSLLEGLLTQEPLGKIAKPTTRQIVSTWRAIAKNLRSVTALVEGPRGVAAAAWPTLLSGVKMRAQGHYPIGPPTEILSMELSWDEWWPAIKHLLECMAETATRHATLAEGPALKPRSKADMTLEMLQQVYWCAEADFRKATGREPPYRYPNFVRVMGEYLPRHLRAYSPEAFAARPRQQRRIALQKKGAVKRNSKPRKKRLKSVA